MTANSQAVRGTLYIISAPSGAGKTSLVAALLESERAVEVSVSHTTRKPRDSEVDGEHYHFVSAETFLGMIEDGQLLEHAKVFDNFYGTSRGSVEERLEAGVDVILEIDWQGARQVRAAVPDAHSIFILPPSRDELERRLRGRGQDAEDVIQRRLRDAESDCTHFREYDYTVVNEDFDQAVRDLASIFRANRLRTVEQEIRSASTIGNLLAGAPGSA
ncbi:MULTISPECIES: guanylate kinase [unclassified Thioalkalivibrio]|uniref:guanylate kinase n=1 Tax=unclassified Thioalkalivibrio TaxID=2621013 RepID=UPI00036C76D4|nr:MULTISPECIES: guanylate kinase [unclassified Thioalkalivibrio]